MPAASFSTITRSAYAVTRSLLRTYIYGALLLIVIVMLGRGVGSGLFAIMTSPQFNTQMGMKVVIGIIAVALTLVGFIAQMLQQVYALVLVVDRSSEVIPTLKKSLRYLLRLIAGGIWIFLRSFAWLAVLSIPCFALAQDYPVLRIVGALLSLAGAVGLLYYFPRLSFTNVIQLQEGKRIKESADLSFARTEGYWGKIVGNNILFMLGVLLCFAGAVLVFMIPFGLGFLLYKSVSPIAALVVGIPLGIACVLAAFIFFFGIALFAQAYIVELYQTIKANPKPKTA